MNIIKIYTLIISSQYWAYFQISLSQFYSIGKNNMAETEAWVNLEFTNILGIWKKSFTKIKSESGWGKNIYVFTYMRIQYQLIA